jgi:hypothetical protein
MAMAISTSSSSSSSSSDDESSKRYSLNLFIYTTTTLVKFENETNKFGKKSSPCYSVEHLTGGGGDEVGRMEVGMWSGRAEEASRGTVPAFYSLPSLRWLKRWRIVGDRARFGANRAGGR